MTVLGVDETAEYSTPMSSRAVGSAGWVWFNRERGLSQTKLPALARARFGFSPCHPADKSYLVGPGYVIHSK